MVLCFCLCNLLFFILFNCIVILILSEHKIYYHIWFCLSSYIYICIYLYFVVTHQVIHLLSFKQSPRKLVFTCNNFLFYFSIKLKKFASHTFHVFDTHEFNLTYAHCSWICNSSTFLCCDFYLIDIHIQYILLYTISAISLICLNNKIIFYDRSLCCFMFFSFFCYNIVMHSN